MSDQAKVLFFALFAVCALAYLARDVKKSMRCDLAMSVLATKADSVTYRLSHDCGTWR